MQSDGTGCGRGGGRGGGGGGGGGMRGLMGVFTASSLTRGDNRAVLQRMNENVGEEGGGTWWDGFISLTGRRG